MQGDPYAGIAEPAQSGADPYADVAAPLSYEDRNKLLQDKIQGGASASDVLNYAGQLGLRITAHLNENVGNHSAHVVPAPAPAPPAPPPPDTSFWQDLKVAGRAIPYGVTDAGGFARNVIGGPIMRIADMFLPKPEDQVYNALDSTNFGKPQTTGQNYLFAGSRSAAAAATGGGGLGGLRGVGTAITSGFSGGLSGQGAKDAGFGPVGQTIASLAGGVFGGGGFNALARHPAPEALPALAEGAVPPAPRGPVAAFNRLTGRDTSVGARLVAQRLADDGINPHDAGRVMSEAQANGTPLALADMGENTRALGGSVSRQPGPARTIAKNFTKERQMGQMDRVKDAINRDIGPTTDIHEESARLMDKAKTDAGPLYQAFHALPARTSSQLEALLSTPAGKAALAKARTIALNDRADMNKLGFDLDAQGNVSLSRSASPQTLDYVKQGLDDVLNESRSQLTGKLVLGPIGRSVEGVRSAFVKEMDRLYPGTYKAARDAYAGPASLNQAMIDGKAALNKSASEIRQRIKDMGQAEVEQYGLGLRSAMADALQGSPDGANKVRALIGNPKRREVLQLLFGSRANLDRFVSTLENEQAAFETYHEVHRGSPTAPRSMEDAANSDMNLLKGVGGDISAVAQGPVGISLRALERGGDLLRFGAGKSGQRAREDASSLLFSTSPTEFENALGKITLQGRRELYRRNALRPVLGGSAAAADQPRK